MVFGGGSGERRWQGGRGTPLGFVLPPARERESLHNVHKAAPAPTSSLSTVSVEKKRKVKVQNAKCESKSEELSPPQSLLAVC